jgi:hypothetical protein
VDDFMMQLLLQWAEMEASMARDWLLIIRAMTTVISFYIAYQVGRRIPESGVLSSTTGMCFYLIGCGLFQWGISLNLFYFDWHYTKILFQLINFAYFTAMGTYVVLTEIEQKRHFAESIGSRFAYKWSVIAIGGYILFILLAFVDPNFFNFAFIYMIFPFIATTGMAMDRFNELKMLQNRRPGIFFLLGLSISGFSNFMFSLPLDMTLVGIIQSLLVILGTLLLVKGWSLIPPIVELKWYLKLGRLMVIHRNNSLAVFSYQFQKQANAFEGEDVLAGGAFSGIQSLLNEILKSDKGINAIDHGDQVIYFNHSDLATFILITQGKAREFDERLNAFKSEFIAQYQAALRDFNGNLVVFNEAEKIVGKVFTKATRSLL